MGSRRCRNASKQLKIAAAHSSSTRLNSQKMLYPAVAKLAEFIMPDSYIIGISKKSSRTLLLSQKVTISKTNVSQLNCRRDSGAESREIFISHLWRLIAVLGEPFYLSEGKLSI